VVMTTFLLAQSDTSAVSDLRAWSVEQQIAAVKSGRRGPFGELCEDSAGGPSASGTSLAKRKDCQAHAE
jgi:hypothetical protein